WSPRVSILANSAAAKFGFCVVNAATASWKLQAAMALLSRLLSRLHFTGKVRHCLPQHAVNCGALAGLEIALQLGEPALNHIARRAGRGGRDDAFDADVGGRLLAREEYFIQPFARPDSREDNIDIASRFEATETNHPLGKIDDLDRLPHVQNVNGG